MALWRRLLGWRWRRTIVGGSLLLGDAVAVLIGTLLSWVAWKALAGQPTPQPINLTDLALFPVMAFVMGLYDGIGPGPVERLRLRVLAIAAWLVVKLLIASLGSSTLWRIAPAVIGGGALLTISFYLEMAIRWLLIERGLWCAPTVIAGSGPQVGEIVRLLRREPELGLEPVAVIEEPPAGTGDAAGDQLAISPDGLPVLIQTPAVSEHDPFPELLMVTDPTGGAKYLAGWPPDRPCPHILRAHPSGSIELPGSPVRTIGGYLAFEPAASNLASRRQALVKRVIDLVVAVPIGLVSLPLIGLMVWRIKSIDPGPAFYVQERVGRNGQPIGVLKLRSMFVDSAERLKRHLAENPEAQKEWNSYFKLRNDPRIIGRTGTFLRRSSLDELPQLWNVIRGDMTLVGPRPFPPYHMASFDPEFRALRVTVQPGLTGLWQVTARSSGDLEVQKACDQRYIETWSLWLDLYLLLATVPAVLTGRGAV